MSYGIKYTSSFKDISGNTYVVNLKQTGFTGTVSGITYYDLSPVILKYEGGRSELDIAVHGSSCDFTFYVDSVRNYDEIFESNYKDWILEVSGSTYYWIGYVKPENFSRPFIQPYKYFINLNAVDGLADLKNVDFPSKYVTGTTSVLQAVKYCLDKIGLGLSITDQCNLKEYKTSSPILKNVQLHLGRFVSSSNGETTYTNCYDALSYVLESFNACIMQRNGKWHIQQKNEVSSLLNSYSSNLQTVTTTAYDRSVDITNNKFAFGSDELSKITPNKKEVVTFQNGSYSSGTNIMSVATGTTFFSTGSSKFDTIGSGGTTVNVFVSNPSSAKDFYSYVAVTKNGTGNTLTLSCHCSPSIAFLSGSAYPFFQFKLLNPTGGTLTDTGGSHLMHSSGDTFMSNPFNITVSGRYKIIFETTPNSATYLSWSLFFNNLSAKLLTPASSTHDKKTTTINLAGSNPLGIDEKTIYYSDSTSQNDIGALMTYVVNSGLTNTNMWSSYAADTAKKKFDNYTFTATTVSPWAEYSYPTIGGGQFWGYDNVNGWVRAHNGGSGYYYSNLFMQSGFTAGLYSLSVDVQNLSAVVGGVNPNISFSPWIKNGSTYTQVNQTYQLTSTAGFSTKTFFFNVPVDNSEIGFGFIRFGPGSDLDVYIREVRLTQYQSPEYQTSHSNLYGVLKLKKRLTYSDFVKVTTYNNQNLFFNSVPIINGTKYETIGYQYDLLNNKIELTLAEFLSNTMLPINTSSSTITLLSVDGQ